MLTPDIPLDSGHPSRPSRRSKSSRGISQAEILEANFRQWNIIDSIANAVLGWIIICTYLFWQDPEAVALSFTGVLFIFIGLICYADIFGVFLYKTNYFIMLYQKRKHPPFPSIRKLKRLGWIANIIWFIIMFVVSKYSFDITYETLSSLLGGH